MTLDMSSITNVEVWCQGISEYDIEIEAEADDIPDGSHNGALIPVLRGFAIFYWTQLSSSQSDFVRPLLGGLP